MMSIKSDRWIKKLAQVCPNEDIAQVLFFEADRDDECEVSYADKKGIPGAGLPHPTSAVQWGGLLPAHRSLLTGR